MALIADIDNINGTITFDGAILSAGGTARALQLECNTVAVELTKQVGIVNMPLGHMSYKNVDVTLVADEGDIAMQMTPAGVVLTVKKGNIIIHEADRSVEDTNFGPFEGDWNWFERARKEDHEDGRGRVPALLDAYYRGGSYEVHGEEQKKAVAVYAQMCTTAACWSDSQVCLKPGLIAALQIAENAGLLPRKIR